MVAFLAYVPRFVFCFSYVQWLVPNVLIGAWSMRRFGAGIMHST